jgi:serine phosphatase RsbU (regulator of sigma subunit)
VALIAAAGEETWPIRSFLGGSTRAILLRTFVPVLALLALVDGWVRARVLEDRSINPAIASAMSAVALTALLLWVIGIVSRKVGARIDAAEAERNLARSDLLALNAQLEDRVWQRTRELRERHEQMGEELRMARELQFALLPHEYPRVAVQDNAKEGALEFLSFFFPSGDVSGDFFTVFPIGPKAAGVIICDVMGHGVRAALITGMVRALVEEHTHAISDPGDLLTHINEGLTAILRQAGTTMFATCFCLVADVGRREFRYANAGHPQPIRVRRQPGAVKVDWLPRSEPSGPAMGLFPQAAYRTMSSPMAAGDLVALYTDGLFEVENAEGDLLTQEDLLKLVRRNADEPAEELLAHLVTEVRTISRSTSFDDDVCVVGAQVKAEAFSGLEEKRVPGFATSFA